MKNRILEYINDPEQLERLYREDKQDFSRSFAEISDEYDSDLLRFWKIRLASVAEKKAGGFLAKELFVVILLSLAIGVLVKLPVYFSDIDPDFFYSRNLATIVFNGLILYTFWQNRIFGKKEIVSYIFIVLALISYVNFLPNEGGDSITLSLIHAPLLLWCLYGFTFVSFDRKNIAGRIDFIRFNGELLIFSGLLIIAGIVLSGITIGLFKAIKIDIDEFYFDNIAVFGLVAAPIVSSYLIHLYPNITNKIAPVIARVFTPLVLITLVIYLVSMILSGTRIFADREILILFNIMLLGVMAIIVFSIAELDKKGKKNINVLILLLLAMVAIMINIIALIAIISRFADGITPNRTVVLTSNILIFINLIIIAKNLFMSYFKDNDLTAVEHNLAKYLPIYAAYIVIVIFIFPILFGFK
jgi:hypothetical protein